MIWDVRLRKSLRQGESRFQIDVAFESAERHLALFGPSGAGKSQVMKMMAGISSPDAGHVVLAGRVLYDNAKRQNLRPQERQLGYVFQDYALFPHLTVRQNVAFGLRRGWLNPARRHGEDARVRRWLDAFGLNPVGDHYPHQISGGQRQRTALARALVNEPQALLLDEPFAALDTGLRQKLRRELRDLQEDLQIPTVLITHDEEDLALLASHVVSLRDGTVV